MVHQTNQVVHTTLKRPSENTAVVSPIEWAVGCSFFFIDQITLHLFDPLPSQSCMHLGEGTAAENGCTVLHEHFSASGD